MKGSLSKGLAVVAVATAGLTGGVIGAANAADMMLPPPPPPPMKYTPPKVVDAGGGFYLRGYIGMSNQQIDDFHTPAAPGGLDFMQGPSADAGIFFGGGIGYEHNDWLRFDVTGEYRGKTRITALDRAPNSTVTPGGFQTNDYDASKSEWLFLANAYWDLGSWKGITPYVGAGIGTSRVTIHDFTDVNVLVPAIGIAPDNDSSWNFAWALHAGAEFAINDRVSFDLGYRYVDLGDGKVPDLITPAGANLTNNPYTIKDITSHDVHLGMRYKFGYHYQPLPELPPPPVVYKH